MLSFKSLGRFVVFGGGVCSEMREWINDAQVATARSAFSIDQDFWTRKALYLEHENGMKRTHRGFIDINMHQ